MIIIQIIIAIFIAAVLGLLLSTTAGKLIKKLCAPEQSTLANAVAVHRVSRHGSETLLLICDNGEEIFLTKYESDDEDFNRLCSEELMETLNTAMHQYK